MLRQIICGVRKGMVLQGKYLRRNTIPLTRFCIRYRHSINIKSTAPLVSATGFNDYASEVRNFQLQVPEYYNFAVDVIDKWADEEKNGKTKRTNPAFWWVDEKSKQEIKWSFVDLADKSMKTAALLKLMCGIQEGDRVLVILPRVPQWWLINIACIRIGAILIPGTTQLTAKDIESRVNQAKIKCVIGDDSVVPNVEQNMDKCPTLECKIAVSETSESKDGWHNFNALFDEVSRSSPSKSMDSLQIKSKSDDLMTIFFTSGTTGLPKMTGHTHASYGLACVITGKYWLDLAPSDIHWNLSDTGWAKSAWSNLFAPWIQGACVFVYNAPGFVAEDILRVLQQYPVTTFCTAPTAYRLLVQSEFLSGFHSDTLRHCVSAGEPLNPEVIDEWFKHTKRQVREGYGQTETVLQVGAFRCLENKPGSMGKPAPGMPVKIIDENCNEVGTWKEGDLAIKVAPDRPLGLFVGYMDDPKQTAAAYRGDYYLTGDRAMVDEDGYFWFVGRSDDVILSSGYRIGPFEVESALIEHAAVAESAVVSSPDGTRGEVVKAFVVLSQSYKNADRSQLGIELQEHVKQTTAPYKYPRKIEFVESLPKTVSGKIRRVELRDREWGRTESTSSADV